MAIKERNGYVAHVKSFPGTYLTGGGKGIGVLGPQDMYVPSDSIKFFTKKPPAKDVPKAIYELKQAVKAGSTVRLENWDTSDPKTLN